MYSRQPKFVGNVSFSNLIVVCIVLADWGPPKISDKTSCLRFKGSIFNCFCVSIIANDEIR